MGYIEDIQKINQLARELLNHKMASSLDEAVEKAKSMLKDDVPLGKIPNPGQPNSQGNSQSQNIKVEEANSFTLQAHERKLKAEEEKKAKDNEMTWQKAMAMNNEYMVGMLKKFEKQIESLTHELARARSELKDLREGQTVANMIKEPSQHTLNQNQPSENRPQQRQEVVKPHPKVGTSNPDQFSVEKIFYCGNK